MYHIIKKKIVRWLMRAMTKFMPLERRVAIERRVRGKEDLRKLGLADVVIVSFGKSGRTWLRVMMSRFYQLRHGLADRWLIGFDNLHRRNQAIPRILFTHDTYLADYTGQKDDKSDYYGKKIVLLVRDPRDVAISQFFQWKFRMRPVKKALNNYPGEDEDIAPSRFIMEERGGLPRVIRFMNAWAGDLSHFNDILVVRYEDMRRDPAIQLRRVLRFMGEQPTDSEISSSVEFASIDNMRKMEQKRTFWHSGGRMQARDRDDPNTYKVRRAKVGGWKDYLDDEQAVAVEAIVDEQMLPGFGYRSDEARSS